MASECPKCKGKLEYRRPPRPRPRFQFCQNECSLAQTDAQWRRYSKAMREQRYWRDSVGNPGD